MEYLNELWVDDEVREMAKWAEEQDEHDLDELWFTISFGGSDKTGVKRSPKDYPETWRTN